MTIFTAPRVPEIGPDSVEFWPHLSVSWPNFAVSLSISDRRWSNSGRILPISEQVWLVGPNLAEIGPDLTELGPTLVDFGPILNDTAPIWVVLVGRFRAGFARIWPTSANLAVFGRHSPEFGQDFSAKFDWDLAKYLTGCVSIWEQPGLLSDILRRTRAGTPIGDLVD